MGREVTGCPPVADTAGVGVGPLSGPGVCGCFVVRAWLESGFCPHVPCLLGGVMGCRADVGPLSGPRGMGWGGGTGTAVRAREPPPRSRGAAWVISLLSFTGELCLYLGLRERIYWVLVFLESFAAL